MHRSKVRRNRRRDRATQADLGLTRVKVSAVVGPFFDAIAT
jgi:hypothetical protein